MVNKQSVHLSNLTNVGNIYMRNLRSRLENQLRPCWQWCANGCDNSHQCWDLQWIVGRVQPIRLCRPCLIRVRGPNNVGRAVQTDPPLLRYALAITEQKKCWELLAQKFDRFHTLCSNPQRHGTTCNKVCKHTQHATSKNAGSFWQQFCVRLHGVLVNYKENVPRNNCCIKVAIKNVVYLWQHPGFC